MKTILVTGSTDGIGMQTAIELAQTGNEVIVHGKNENCGREVADNIKRLSNNDAVHYFNADFTDFNEIRKLADAKECKPEKYLFEGQYGGKYSSTSIRNTLDFITIKIVWHYLSFSASLRYPYGCLGNQKNLKSCLYTTSIIIKSIKSCKKESRSKNTGFGACTLNISQIKSPGDLLNL